MNIFMVNDMLMEVDFNFRRVRCVKYKNCPIFVQVHNVQSSLNETDCLPPVVHQYPNLSCSLKLPKTNANTLVKFVHFNEKNKTIRLESVKLDSSLYYTHHRKNNIYLFGLVPAAVYNYDKLNSLTKSVFIGSPIFDSNNKLLSFVTDHYLDVNSEKSDVVPKEILPVVGESYRLQSFFCLTGQVRIYNETDEVARNVVGINESSKIDINVVVCKNQVEVFIVYEGNTISYVKVKCKFAGSLLIV
ncbi:P26-2 [Artaxa digramma nucleopolyhedrovirus]|uniref:P26-2 n=1 Tax=Artaxa digramma nucleopolyhedrovirus TaxID=3070910 RepID=A0AAE6R6W7_9ABAC|nr:P26-2 [Euproctis digramma nucleopolyhedrovirus]QHB21724.1 P26-2 [Artaxa digramma nucleopolyhedrovirus]